MQRILLLIVWFVPFMVMAQGPITITVADIADAGDEYFISQASPLEELELGVTGEEIVWNYDYLSPITTNTTIWIEAIESNPAYFLFWFGSDVAEETGQGFDSEFFSLEDILNFYKRTTSVFSLTGQAGTLGGIPFPILYDDPEPVYQFPMEFGQTFTSSTGFEFEVPGFGTWLETRDKSCEVDGWGTITTPYGTFDVLRQKCVNEIYDLFTTDGFEFPIEYTATEYRWVASDQGIPVLQVNTQSVLGLETVTGVSYKDTLADVVSITNGANAIPLVNLWSNTGGELVIGLQSDQAFSWQAAIIDLQGRLIYSSADQAHVGYQTQTTLYPSIESSGYYLLQIVTSEGQRMVRPFIWQP